MHVYDIAVIGAGAAGMMAAIEAALLKRDVVLIERNNAPGRKILLTGKGRCNITNTAAIDTFIEEFGRQGAFFRSAFSAFFNCELIDFFKARGLALKAERQGRVFPATDRACSVVAVLKRSLTENKIKLLYNARLMNIEKRSGLFQLETEGKDRVYAKKVILATGGASYKMTGSCGDGYRIAGRLGHTIVPLRPALVPLKVREDWVRQIKGLSLRNIRVIFRYGNRKVTSGVGEVVFTHFGVSGPLILDLSGRVVSALDEHKEVFLYIDLKPGLTPEQLDKKLLRESAAGGNMQLKNFMKGLLPYRLIPVFLHIAGLAPGKRINQLGREGRHEIIRLLKALPLTVTGSLSIEEAMVTTGGVSVKEIDPRTMESKVVPGLYFAGEVIEGCASSGGYNLQQAFSTGYLAGNKAGCDA